MRQPTNAQPEPLSYALQNTLSGLLDPTPCASLQEAEQVRLSRIRPDHWAIVELRPIQGLEAAP